MAWTDAARAAAAASRRAKAKHIRFYRKTGSALYPKSVKLRNAYVRQRVAVALRFDKLK